MRFQQPRTISVKSFRLIQNPNYENDQQSWFAIRCDKIEYSSTDQ